MPIDLHKGFKKNFENRGHKKRDYSFVDRLYIYIENLAAQEEKSHVSPSSHEITSGNWVYSMNHIGMYQ